MEKIYDAKYLEKAAEVGKAIKQRSYKLLNINSGHKILDLGCGSGVDVIEMSKIVGSTGCIVGIDHDHRMIEVANKSKLVNSIDNVEFLQSEANFISFKDNYFDAVRTERVFQHLHEPIEVMKEAFRVLKPGSKFVLIETDWASLSIYSDKIEITQKVVSYLTTKMLINGLASRNILHYFELCGVQNVHFEVFPFIMNTYEMANELIKLSEVIDKAKNECFISNDEHSQLIDNLNLYNKKGCFCVSMNIFIYSTEK